MAIQVALQGVEASQSVRGASDTQIAGLEQRFGWIIPCRVLLKGGGRGGGFARLAPGVLTVRPPGGQSLGVDARGVAAKARPRLRALQAGRGSAVSNEIENYLAAFNEAEGLAANLKRVADSLARVAAALQAETMIEVPEPWPNLEQLRNLVTELNDAKARACQLWSHVPSDMQPRLPRPSRVAQFQPVTQ